VAAAVFPLYRRIFAISCTALDKGNSDEERLITVVIAGLLFSFEASAQERVGTTALGVVAGAIVLGPLARWPAGLSVTRQDPGVRIPEKLGDPHRARGFDVKRKPPPSCNSKRQPW
jgi:hypothetical protein